MKLIKFSKMYGLDYTIKHVFAMDQKWSDNQTFSVLERPRKTSAFVYFINCDATYTPVTGETVCVKKGSLIYLPQGALYKVRFHQCGDAVLRSQLIEFELLDEHDEPFVVSPAIRVLDLPEAYDLASVFHNVITLYNRPIRPYGQIKSKCFAFLNELCRNFREERMYSKKYMPIAKGIAYLEQTNSYELSVAEIANMCHVSETYFRRLFEKYSGVSPQRYKNNSLLRQAKDMIRSGDLTFKEIANQLGFSDAGYFSRWFKKNTGITPSQFSSTRLIE